jgi:hypothetical protein
LLIPERPWRQLTLHQRGYRQEPWVIAELRIAAGLSD